QGDLDLAHARIATDVATSPALRDGPEVRDIESRWADAVLARAEQEQDVPTRRMLLNAVAQSATVDATRRRTAADKLKEADFLGTDIHELPPAAKPAAATAQSDSPKASKSETTVTRASELALQGPEGEARARAQLEAK